MAVGKVSLEDWDRFTSSLGCRRGDPAAAFPQWAMTSFRFMLVWVPLPVCHTTRGKSSASSPARMRSQTSSMRRSFSSVIFAGRRAWFARAAAFFSSAKARMISSGIRSRLPPMGKF